MQKDKRVSVLLTSASHRFQEVSSTPRLDAELLLAHVLNQSRAWLIAHATDEVSEESYQFFHAAARRRSLGEPVAYITGRKEFFDLELHVNSSVLIPRPETELLVEHAISFLQGLCSELTVFDLGTGSGCIAVSIAKWMNDHGKSGKVFAVDREPNALEVASRNARTYGLDERISFVESDWFSGLQGSQADLIVSNPPYIAIDDPLRGRETNFEPSAALFSGVDGLDAIRLLLRDSAAFLRAGGVLLFEHGAAQREEISELLESECASWEIPPLYINDLAGLARAVQVRKMGT